jgi:hypothetical protein
MARNWSCLMGRHDWRVAETPDRDKYAECNRCGKTDWRRLITKTSSKWTGSHPPPGAGGE